jgi:large subunit ribosomal protein L24
MLKVRRNDTVYVAAGKDRGKKGKVLRIFLKENRAIVEGVNLIKKHKRRTREDQQGGIVQIESPIHISNLMPMCKNCNRQTRVGIVFLKDGTKARICKKCKEVI